MTRVIPPLIVILAVSRDVIPGMDEKQTKLCDMCKYLESSPVERGHREGENAPNQLYPKTRRSLRSRGEFLAFPLGAVRYLFFLFSRYLRA
jgi:hypothetical protein